MLEFETTQNPKAVEEIFCVKMDSFQKKEMSEDDSNLFATLCLSQSVDLETLEHENLPFLVQLIIKRLAVFYTVELDSKVILMISHISKSAGNAVMYLTYTQYLCKKNNIQKLNWQQFVELFAFGFFSESDLQDAWLSQKIKSDGFSDNLLDYRSATLSIQF